MPSIDKDDPAVRFAVLNTVPPGFCRKMHLLAPGGRLSDLAAIRRDELATVGLSPTNMEAVQGFAEWRKRGISPCLGLLLWYLESVQLDNGSFLRTADATEPSVGVTIRFLQLAGQSGIHRGESEPVERAAYWLESQVTAQGLIRMPASGAIDHGMLGRSIRALTSVQGAQPPGSAVEGACAALSDAALDSGAWSTYPGGEESCGATSLILSAITSCPDQFETAPDPSWLLDARNPDGGWGEYPGSPSRIDNTFWATRACLDADANHDPASIDPSLLTSSTRDGYETAMAQRLRVLAGLDSDTDVAELALKSLTDDADRYAETALYGLAVSEHLQADLRSDSHAADSTALPVRTPQFLRREPPLYDQLADASQRSWWRRTVEYAARARIAEASIGWLAGVSASIAITGNELVDGLASLGPLPLIAILIVEAVITLGWLTARQQNRRPVVGLSHFLIAIILATLVVALIANPEEVQLPAMPAAALTLLLALIIEVVSVATDKADLLNRLDED